MNVLKFFRRKVFRCPSFVMALCAIFLVASCAPTELKRGSIFSGEDYINGLFFATGEVAALIPEINSRFSLKDYVKDENERLKIDEIRNQIVKSIDTDFLRKFKIEIESGNHLRVQNALLNAAQELRTIATREDGPLAMRGENGNLIEVIHKEYQGKVFSREELNNILSNEFEDGVIQLANKDFGNFDERQTCVIAAIAVFGWLFLVAAVAVYVFIAEVIAFWVDVCIWTDDAIFSAETFADGQLFREQLINSITLSFAE